MRQLNASTLLQGGKYKIEKVLGQGGFGITYLATQELLERKVCIKEFFFKEYCDRDEVTSHVTLGTQTSREIVERFMTKFLKEARTISKLEHPNIIRIHDIFMENNTAYYVMDYIDGESLSEMVKRRGALSESEAVEYIKQVASALDFIHQHSINHLDVKPANIMVSNSDGKAILIDFGLSKQYDAQGGQTSTTPVGISHGYAPMEQYKQGGVNTFSPQTDIYSLGATLYKLVTGNTPPQAMDLIDEGLPSLPSSLSTSVVEAIKKAMQFRKVDRPNNLSEFLILLNSPTQRTPLVQQIIKEQSPKECSEETKVLTGKDNILVEEVLVIPKPNYSNDVKTATAEPSLSSKTLGNNIEKKIEPKKSPNHVKVNIYLVCTFLFVVLTNVVGCGSGDSILVGIIFYLSLFAVVVCTFLLSRELRLYNKASKKKQNPIINFLLVSSYTTSLFFINFMAFQGWDIPSFMEQFYYTLLILIPIGIAQLLLWDKKGLIIILIGLGLLLFDEEYWFPHYVVFLCLSCLSILLTIKQSGVNTWNQLDFNISINKHKSLYLFFIIELVIMFGLLLYRKEWQNFIWSIF